MAGKSISLRLAALGDLNGGKLIGSNSHILRASEFVVFNNFACFANNSVVKLNTEGTTFSFRSKR